SLLKKKSVIPSALNLEEEECKLLTEWYHFAILSLAQLKDCKSDPIWIAKRLNIPVSSAAESLRRLEKMKIIEIKDGRFKQISPPIRVIREVPSRCTNAYYKSLFEVAQKKMETVDLKYLKFSSFTLAISTR